MKYFVKILAETVLLALLCSTVALAFSQDEIESSPSTDSAEKNEVMKVDIQIDISAEGETSLPSGAKIQWRGVDDACKKEEGEQTIATDGKVSLKLPICEVKFKIFITGFDTKAVNIDLAGKKEKFKIPVSITIRHKGSPKVDWSLPEL